MTDQEDDFDDRIEGRNAVIEALRAGVVLDKVYIARGSSDDGGRNSLGFIAGAARAAGAVVVDADKRKLDGMSKTGSHQGVIAVCSATEYVSVEDILAAAAEKNETPLIIICDEITDPHNLGAIIRTAEAAGAHGVIIPKRRGAGATAVVAKASAGAVFHVPVARVPNTAQAIAALKKAGVWIYGAVSGGETPLWDTDFLGAAAIVIGSEGDGIGRLVLSECDFTVGIPMSGKVSSLNASVSASLLMYEVLRQRRAVEGN
ncbi:MAG: 23S rRNA (guanosine(2251)-2'-O)-methyltransferase RlmB [Oscillospiraceae bacterium]|nr:23S rRNA (guanosine(2251)-2'-O)-methyltransferase RlmB [Oscillospiraceae bacterium]